MSKRSQIIFSAALVFAARTVVLADPVSLCATLLFLGAHYLDRFLGQERFESKAYKRVQDLENEIKSMKSEITSVKLAQGMRGGRQ